jgi:predicted enzyme related to lactoylglutathione lyase
MSTAAFINIKKGNHMSTQTMTQENATIGSLVWFEIPADNLDRARKFYSGLFNWKISPFQGMQGPEAQKYLHIETGGAEASADGGLTTREHIQGITQYIGVASVDESAAKVEKLGGKVRQRKTAVPQMGYFAICQDTENNTFALWESDSDAR